MSTATKASYAAMRRRFVVGATFTVTHSKFPHASGERRVVKVQSNAIASTPTDPDSALAKRLDGKLSWHYWGAANSVRIEADDIHVLFEPGSEQVWFTYTIPAEQS